MQLFGESFVSFLEVGKKKKIIGFDFYGAIFVRSYSLQETFNDLFLPVKKDYFIDLTNFYCSSGENNFIQVQIGDKEDNNIIRFVIPFLKPVLRVEINENFFVDLDDKDNIVSFWYFGRLPDTLLEKIK